MSDVAVLTVAEAKRLKGSFVYALCEMNRMPFYVGKTTSALSRFSAHSAGETKNKDLRDRLLKKGWGVKILRENPDDLNAAEREEIRKNSPGLLNIILADDGRWEGWSKNADPWSAGTKYKSPSAYCLPIISPEARKIIRSRFASMTTAERCRFELNLWGSWSERFRDQFSDWYRIAWPNMAKYVIEV